MTLYSVKLKIFPNFLFTSIMEKATWEEIKALASDFKRTQAITSNQKLTERNCIDIINYLCGSKQLSLYFTTDGKTFLTPQELEKEIYEELEIAHGRIELTKLSSVIDLEFYTIENTIHKIVTSDHDLQVVNGNLVNSSYIRSIALKINEITKDKGKATILELTQVFSLPKQFIEKVIANNIDNIIEAHRDSEMLYTNNFIRRHTAMIRGYLTRSSKPVAISFLNQKFSIFEKLIIRIISELIEKKRIFGKLDQNKTFFIPDILIKNQKLYFQRFYEQNNYLDFQTMKEIGIQNPSKYVELEFPTLTILSSCALGDGIISQLEVSIQECDKAGNFFNCYQIIPTIVKSNDLHDLVRNFLDKNERLVFIGEEFVVSKEFIGKCVASFDEIIRCKAEEFVRKNKKSIVNIMQESSIQDSFEEDTSIKKEKISKFKSGGGLTGREIKVKSVKNKYTPDRKLANQKSTNRKSSNDCNTSQLEFLNEDEGLKILSKQLSGEEVTDDLSREIFQLIDKQLHFNYKNQCKLAFLQTSDSAKSKTEHQNLEMKLSTMIGKIRLFERGLQEISIDSLKSDLIRYNLKALGSDVVNCLFEHIAVEHEFSWDSAAAGITNELKTKLINHVPHNLSVVMKTLNKSLKDENASFENFYSALDTICEFLGIRPKKFDKKLDKNQILEIGAQYHSIISEKSAGNQYIEPGELLLIATVLIFQKIIGLPLHATGKFVPAILEFLKSKTRSIDTGIDWESLKAYQDYVVATFKLLHNATEQEKEAFKESHRDLHQKVVEIALNWKSIKSG